MCASRKLDELTTASAVLFSVGQRSIATVGLKKMWIGEVEQVSGKYFIHCIAQALKSLSLQGREMRLLLQVCVCVCTHNSSQSMAAAAVVLQHSAPPVVFR